MSFRQKGQEEESPFEFLMRRLEIVRLFFMLPIDSDLETHQVMEHAAPLSWIAILRWPGRTMSAILEDSRLFQDALICDWESEQRRFQRSTFRRRSARLAETGNRSVSDHPEEKEGSDDDNYQGDARIARSSERRNNFQSPNLNKPFLQNRGKGPSNSKPRIPWTGNPPFPKDDSVVSAKPPPPGGCLACGSDKHWYRDCKHYRKSTVKFSHIAEAQEDIDAYANMILEKGDPPF